MTLRKLPSQRNAYDNLILLCPTHHAVIDDDDQTYTVERIHKMKSDHEAGKAPAPEQQTSRIAELFVQQAPNVALSGGVAASVIHAGTFHVHQPPADTLTRTRQLQAIEHLWDIIGRLKTQFTDLRYVHMILTTDEMDAFFKKGWPPRFQIDHYAANDTPIRKFAAAGCNDADKERLFVHPRVWGVFFIIRAVYGRLGYLFERSFKERGAALHVDAGDR
jgi:hypothetical protein